MGSVRGILMRFVIVFIELGLAGVWWVLLVGAGMRDRREGLDSKSASGLEGLMQLIGGRLEKDGEKELRREEEMVF